MLEKAADAAHLRNGFLTQEQLDAWLKQREEAEKRDHRRLGKELDPFSIQEQYGQGLIFWHRRAAPFAGDGRLFASSWPRVATDWFLRRTLPSAICGSSAGTKTTTPTRCFANGV